MVVNMLAGGRATARSNGGEAVTCGGCGHLWSSNARDNSTIRCPKCGKPRKMKRPAASATAAADVRPAAPPVVVQDSPPRPSIPGLQPSAIRPCDLCISAGHRGANGRNPAADWAIRISFADGSEDSGAACSRCVRAVVSDLAGRGARIRLDPAARWAGASKTGQGTVLCSTALLLYCSLFVTSVTNTRQADVVTVS